MKKNVIFSVIAVLLVIGVGISFAYFTSGFNVTGDGSDVTATPGDFMKVVYDAGSEELNTEGMVPGDIASKKFSVTISPTANEKEATYAIILNIHTNTFVKCDDSNYDVATNACIKDEEELIYRLKNESDQVIAEGILMGVTGELKLITETKTVEVETTYQYTLEIEFVETNADQNHNANKVLNGSIEVEISNKTLRDQILADNPTIDNSRNGAITGSLTGNTTGTLFTVEDDDGTSYMYAGSVDNNWVSFAGFYWRIIRINGDGSIRLIYNGTNTAQEGTATQITVDGSNTFRYNQTYGDNTYLGYMMGLNNECASTTTCLGTNQTTSYEQSTSNIYNSNIKDILDNWYQVNLLSQSLSISKESGFCNDRQTMSVDSSYGTLGYGSNFTSYAAWGRLYQNGSWKATQMPSLKCGNASRDLFTVSESSKGNKSLDYPIGLITSDEVVFAGGFGGTANSNYYLYTGQLYWTMSPYFFHSSNYTVGAVGSTGALGGSAIINTLGVRPVINLRSDITISFGDGTSSNPYRIEVA